MRVTPPRAHPVSPQVFSTRVTSMVEVRVWTVLLRVRKVFKGAPQIGQNLGAGSIRMWVLSVKLITLTSLRFFRRPPITHPSPKNLTPRFEKL